MAAVAILAMGALNYVGVSSAAVVMNLTTIAKFGALAALGAAGVHGRHRQRLPLHAGLARAALDLSLHGTALIAIMWTYDGWADLSFMGGEVKDPGRTLPLALILGTAAIVLVYLLLNVAYIYLVPLPEMAGRQADRRHRGGADPAVRRRGRRGRVGHRDALLLRRAHRLDDDGARGSSSPWPTGASSSGRIARVSPRFQSPSVAIWLATTLGVVYVLFNDFQQLADKFILGHLAVLRAGGGGGVRAAADPARHAAPLPHLGLSGGADAVPAGLGGDGGERALDRSGEHRDHVRDHPGGDSGVLRVAGVEWAGAVVPASMSSARGLRA